MSLSPGDHVGPYEIIVQLGAGGMGEVYRARDPRLSRDVAIKILPVSIGADAERLRRFEQEARATGSLNHPNIVAIFDFGNHEGRPYVVVEYLHGNTLKDEMGGDPLPQRKAVEYALRIAHGLAAAHAKGIVHRDLKPENVFVTSDGQVKILDFGLAKLTRHDFLGTDTSNAPTIANETEAGVVLGTVGYMSPEQVRGRAVDHRTDIFAFGVILYEMLTGMKAFSRDSAVETMHAILKDDPPTFSQSGRHLPPGLERIVGRCLEKKSDDRFHSAQDLAFALEALSASSTIHPAIEDLPPERPARPIGQRALIAIVGASVFVLGAMIAMLGGRLFKSGTDAAPAFAGLIVKTAPSKARVTVGGRQVRGPLAAFDSLAAGACSLTVELDGYQPITRVVMLQAGSVAQESVGMRPVPATRTAEPRSDRSVSASPPPARRATTGFLRVFSGRFSLEVELNGKPTGRMTPCLFDGLAPGPYSVFLKDRPGYEVRGDPRTVAVVAGDTVDVNFSGRILQKGRGR